MKELLTEKGIIFKEKKIFFSKLRTFLNAGKEKIHLLLDFDRTLTKSQNELGENVSAWEILRAHLSPKSQKKYQEFYNKYYTLEVEGQLTAKDAVIWWEKILGLFKRDKLRWSDIVRDVEKKMPIRPYTKELFEICEKKNIPVIIISAGIKNIIEYWCQRVKIKPKIILSTNLIFSSQGYMMGWQKDSLIHALNKKEKGHKEIREIKLKRPNTILIGDSLDDASMIEGEKNVLRVVIWGTIIKKRFREANKSFDLIIRSGNFYPVIKILKLFK